MFIQLTPNLIHYPQYAYGEIESGHSIIVGPYSHSESNQKESVIDGNTTTGSTSTSEKSNTKVESGGITPIETTEKNGVTTTGISVSGEINAGLLGVGAKIGMTTEPSSNTGASVMYQIWRYLNKCM